METMYDRLGDLLSETLEAGHVKLVKPKPSENNIREEKDPPVANGPLGQEESRKDERFHAGKSTGKAKSRDFNRHRNGTGTVIKTFPEELNRAYRLLGITVSATKEDVKKAYKEKLQYYHPDKHAGNAILEKVATDKTRQVVESYAMIIKHLEEMK